MFKQENIANIENVDLHKDIDFSEEIDKDSVFKELDGETEHISAIFDAMHDKQAQKNTVKVEMIEDKSENIILSDNKSDEQRPNLNSVNNPVRNSANNSANRVTASTRKNYKKIMKPSTSSSTSYKPLKSINTSKSWSPNIQIFFNWYWGILTSL